jgi:uncharacterized protein YkwD
MTTPRTITVAVALMAAMVLPSMASAKTFDPSDRMLAKFNKVRAKHGLADLREAPKLAQSSRGYAIHLIRTGSFGHGSAWTRNGFRRTGEILALRRGWSRKASPALRQWLHSPSHSALILDKSFRYVGVSPARGHFGGARTTVWVAHLGAH